MSSYIRLSDLMAFPIRLDHYDKENGDERFVRGIETVLEFAQYLPEADVEPVLRGGLMWKHRKFNSVKKYTGVDDTGETHTVQVVERYEADLPYCNMCGKDAYADQRYCRYCGAKMEEEC